MLLIAMDKARSVRSFDADGRLHVAVSNISKANICEYAGKEIPGWRNLGLDPNRVYRLLRHPDELAKGIATFNNLPILSEHIPVTAIGEDSHMPGLVVGSTGTDAAIDGPYLTNSLVIWAKPSIDGIVNDEKRELSSAYRYIADMTPGNFEGVDYDGVMRDIVGNHVALVFEGRAGSDVVVGDEQPMAFKSKRALMLAGGLGGLIRPLLAQDAKLDLGKALTGVSHKSLTQKGATRKLGETIYGLTQPHLAQDADLDVEDVCKVIEAVQGTPMAEDDDIPEPGIPPVTGAADEGGEGEAVAKVLNFLRDKLSDDDYAAAARLVQAEEAMDEASDDDKDKPAMDAATVTRRISEAAENARKGALADAAAIRTAEREVQPVVGELVAMDSASAVYRAGLEALGVDVTKLPASAYGETFRAVKAVRDAVPTMAHDSRPSPNSRNDFDKRFPKRTKLIRG